MKAVIALVIALALLAVGIPLSRAISDGEEHTITRTVDPTPEAPEKPLRDTAKPRNTGTADERAKTASVQAPVER